MPKIHITKDIDGRLCGVDEKDNRAYSRFITRCVELTDRDVLTFSWSEPRSGPYHRRHFSMLGKVFRAQETFVDEGVFRKWLEMESGYCEQVATPNGVVKVPKSIDYETLDQKEFEPIHDAVFAFMRTEIALLVIWPHLQWQAAYDMLDSILGEFER